MRVILQLAVLLVGLWLHGSLHAQTGQTLQRVANSVFKIEAGGSAASGFLWQDASHVVTALHVVDGQTNIVAHQINSAGQIVFSSPVQVVRVHKDSDLVLLRLQTPANHAPLQISSTKPAVKQQLDAVGFPLNISGYSNTQVAVRFGGNQLRSILPPKALASIQSYPSKTVEILNLEGNLVPGLSGAPIVDDQGLVVGVVDGGLEDGAIGISWGIPASHLQKLAASSVTTLPNAARIRELFSADLNVDVASSLSLGRNNLTKLRTRSFRQLAATADDQLGLAQLANLFQMFNPQSFMYDIYQYTESGATIVVPAGAQLREQGGFILAATGDPRMKLKFKVVAVTGTTPYELDQQAVLLEQRLFNPEGSALLHVDPQWSYLSAMTRFGIKVRRKGVYRNTVRIWPNGYQQEATEKYFFETLATNGSDLLITAAINEDNSPETIQKENYCMAVGAPECAPLFESRKRWAQLVLGVQFSTFPPVQM